MSHTKRQIYCKNIRNLVVAIMYVYEKFIHCARLRMRFINFIETSTTKRERMNDLFDHKFCLACIFFSLQYQINENLNLSRQKTKTYWFFIGNGIIYVHCCQWLLCFDFDFMTHWYLMMILCWFCFFYCSDNVWWPETNDSLQRTHH